LHRPYSEFASQIEFANACVCKCLELANRYEREASVVLIILDSWIEIAGKRGERASTVFSEKGDGNTKDSAICFSKARTHLEEVEISIGIFGRRAKPSNKAWLRVWRKLRVRPETSGRITEFSKHEAD
jgi:hypothetical protein